MDITLILLGFWEGVGGFFGAMIGIFFMVLLLSWFAKLFNVNIIDKRGRTFITPDDFDNKFKLHKEEKEADIETLKSLLKEPKSLIEKKYDNNIPESMQRTLSRIRNNGFSFSDSKLGQAFDLYRNGIITEKEYNKLIEYLNNNNEP